MLGLIPLSLHRLLCSTDCKLVICIAKIQVGLVGLLWLQVLMSSLQSLLGFALGFGCSGICCTGLGLQQLRVFTARAVVSQGSRASSYLLTACTAESGKVWSWLQVKVLASHRVCRNHQGWCTLRQSVVTVVFLPGACAACPKFGFDHGEVLWGGLFTGAGRSPDAGPLICCSCVNFFGEILLDHNTLCVALKLTFKYFKCSKFFKFSSQLSCVYFLYFSILFRAQLNLEAFAVFCSFYLHFTLFASSFS